MSAANTTSEVIAVVLGGTNVPLPNDQMLNTFTVNGANDTFTVPATGTYLISYRVSTTAALGISSRVNRSGVPIDASIIAPIVSLSLFTSTFTDSLTAGDTLVVQLFGLIAVATLEGGAGADLTVVRLS